MKIIFFLTTFLAVLFCGCENQEAIQINTSAKLEQRILRELKIELTQNLEDITSNIQSLKSSKRANEVVIGHMDGNVKYHDSLDVYFANLYPYLVFLPNTTTFDHLESRSLFTITNDSLRASISNLFGVQYELYKSFETTYFVEHYTNYIKPMFMKEFESFKFYRSFKPIDYNRFINSNDNRRVMTYTIDAIETFIIMQSGLKMNVQKLIAEIDNELSE